MILALIVLLYMDDRSLADWRLRVQPNTIIAFLSTLIRATLIYPLSECIGHLKWVFFEKPRSLNFMHTFDIASRGPLGAFNFLWKARFASPLTSSAAFATILLLLFQPLMQQKIVFSTRPALMSNETATVTRTTAWKLWDFADSQGPGKHRKC
jgi:hypothetical protein